MAAATKAGLLVAGIALTGCGQPGSESVTTDTLGVATAAALDCAAAMQQSLYQGKAIVFMDPASTPGQVDTVRSALISDTAVAGVSYISQDQALAEFKLLFTDSPQLTQAVKASLLPASFRFTIDSTAMSAQSGDPLSRYRGLPGVKAVIPGTQRLRCSETDPAMVKAAQRMIDNRYANNSLIVFMNPQATDYTISQMRQSLIVMADVHSIVYLSKDDSLVEFDCMFKNDPKMISSVTKEILPPSFRIDVGIDRAVIDDRATMLKQSPGVKTVTKRPTAAELVSLKGSGGPGDMTGMNPDCPVKGQRIK